MPRLVSGIQPNHESTSGAGLEHQDKPGSAKTSGLPNNRLSLEDHKVRADRMARLIRQMPGTIALAATVTVLVAQELFAPAVTSDSEDCRPQVTFRARATTASTTDCWSSAAPPITARPLSPAAPDTRAPTRRLVFLARKTGFWRRSRCVGGPHRRADLPLDTCPARAGFTTERLLRHLRSDHLVLWA